MARRMAATARQSDEGTRGWVGGPLPRIYVTESNVDDPEFVQAVADAIRRWAPLLGVAHVDVQLTVYADPESDDAASIDVQPSYHVASLWVNRAIDDDWLDHYIRHELCHVAVAELQEFARRHTPVQFADEFTEAVETVVSRLTRAPVWEAVDP